MILSLALSAAIAPAAADEVIFRREVAIRRDGTVSEREVVGSTVVEQAEGARWAVTTRDLISPDGDEYGVDWDIGQETEDADLVVSLTVTRFDAPLPSLEELAVPWADADREGSVEAWVKAVASAGEPDVRSVQTVNEQLREWIAEDDDGSTRTLVLQLANVPVYEPPPPLDDLLDTDPVAFLDRWEARLLYREAYRSDVEAALLPVERILLEEGAEVIRRAWLAGAVFVEATREEAAAYVGDTRFGRVDWEGEIVLDSNDGAEVRASTQVDQFLTAGYTGETYSGMSARDDIFIVVADDCIDEDHPAWNDEGPSYISRLGTVWRWDSGLYRPLLGTEDSATGDCHGMGVTSILVANLFDGQDPLGRPLPAQQAQSSGNAIDATFDFIENNGPFDAVAGKIVALDPDVFTMSYSNGGWCDVDFWQNGLIDAIYANNTFVAKSAANDHHMFSTCTVNAPATAGGAFVAGALNETGVADLNAGPLESSSNQGRDVHGRAMIDLVAPGRETSATPKWNNSYRVGAFGRTSAAAPTIGGAAAVLKDHHVNLLGSTWANDVGNLHATMLLMGDGTLSAPYSSFGNPASNNPGATATGGAELDQRWGAGRMRMRKFDHDGMDGPWRARWCLRTVTMGAAISPCLANPDGAGVNQALPQDVERLRATAFWYEPNLGSVEDPANIAFAAYRNGAFLYQTGGTAPGEKRLREDAAGGHLWDVRLLPWCVPPDGAIYNSAAPYGNCNSQASRKVHVALYWEDMDRDDGGFPPASVQ